MENGERKARIGRRVVFGRNAKDYWKNQAFPGADIDLHGRECQQWWPQRTPLICLPKRLAVIADLDYYSADMFCILARQKSQRFTCLIKRKAFAYRAGKMQPPIGN